MVMATDSDLPDFQTAFHHSLRETSHFQQLLAHPEFRDQLHRLCRRIAKREDAADLLDAVCLRLSKQAVMELPQFRNERQFFGWVAAVAMKVHRDQRRHRLETMSCTARAKHWPDSSADVPEELIDQYMDHAEECAYHAELIFLEEQEAEQELRSIFRLARGLDSQGRLLKGELLKTVIADYERRLASWNKEFFTLPVNHIALYNGGREIASCGRFFDFTRHQSINELDPQAGLQIRGISNVDFEDVLLGSYPLANVRHEGVEEQLSLENGFTVGLTVVPLNEKIFAIEFRCVETESLKDFSAEREHTSKAARVPDWLGKCGISPKASAINALQFELEKTHLLLLKYAAYLKQSTLSSLGRVFTRPLRAVQVGAIVLVVGLAIEQTSYLNRWLVAKSTIHPMSFVAGLVNTRPRTGDDAHAKPELKTPPPSNRSDPQPKTASTVKPLVIAAQGEAVSARKDEHPVFAIEDSPARKLIQYTSRVEQQGPAATTLTSKVSTVAGTSKLVQMTNTSFHRVAPAPDRFTSNKLSGACPGKDKQ
jgi:DNA-directed RNA polymerase specialized sigma24 family protein